MHQPLGVGGPRPGRWERWCFDCDSTSGLHPPAGQTALWLQGAWTSDTTCGRAPPIGAAWKRSALPSRREAGEIDVMFGAGAPVEGAHHRHSPARQVYQGKGAPTRGGLRHWRPSRVAARRLPTWRPRTGSEASEGAACDHRARRASPEAGSRQDRAQVGARIRSHDMGRSRLRPRLASKL